jgi:nucleoside-diphosphate-sugar epimerase
MADTKTPCGETLLLTGATGALGLPLLIEFLRSGSFGRIIATVRDDGMALRAAVRREAPDVAASALEVIPVELGSAEATASLASLRAIDTVVHAAACTQFRAAPALLRRVNVDGTRQVLEWAETLTPPPRIVHLSTTCVAGQRTGPIAEAPLPDDCGFVNAYERTKWQAEQLVAASPLAPEIVRLATVIGRWHDGYCARPGAFHTAVRWLQAGLLPLIPGDETTRLDLLPTELATGFISRLLARPRFPRGIYHVSCGHGGVPLASLLELGAERFARRHAGWRTGQIMAPVLATRAAFEDFRRSVVQSRDLLFNQVLTSVDAFLPELFYPKQYATTHAAAVWNGVLPMPEWRPWMTRVMDAALDLSHPRVAAAPVPA